MRKSTPFGGIEIPVNPITSAIMNGATFVARAFSADGKQLVELMTKAIEHKGFALIDIFSPCVTFNHDNDYAFFKERIKKLEDEDHNPGDWKAACEKALLWGDTIYTGLFLQLKDRKSLGRLEPVLDEGGPLAHRPLGVSREQSQSVIKRMM